MLDARDEPLRHPIEEGAPAESGIRAGILKGVAERVADGRIVKQAYQHGSAVGGPPGRLGPGASEVDFRKEALFANNLSSFQLISDRLCRF